MIETALTYFFTVAAVLGGMLMLVARHPMRAALALVCSMLSLAGVYAMLGVHVIAVFQVLIYVGAVMIFMVYTIMLLRRRPPPRHSVCNRSRSPSWRSTGSTSSCPRCCWWPP